VNIIQMEINAEIMRIANEINAARMYRRALTEIAQERMDCMGDNCPYCAAGLEHPPTRAAQCALEALNWSVENVR